MPWVVSEGMGQLWATLRTVLGVFFFFSISWWFLWLVQRKGSVFCGKMVCYGVFGESTNAMIPDLATRFKVL